MKLPLVGLTLAVMLSVIPAAGAQSSTQGAGERAAQAKLPQGRSPIWATLRTTRISEDDAHGIFRATHPAAVKALVGRTLTLPGFLMPLDTAARTNHFLLSKYTPVCAFCPPGAPNEVIEVRTAQAIANTTRLVHVTGRFGLQNNGDNGLFFQLSNAAVQ